MKALALLLLLPQLALAQAILPPSSTPAGLSGTNTGDVTVTAVGSSPSANGASLSGQALSLQPADSTHPGVILAGAQTLAGPISVVSNLLPSVTNTPNLGSTSKLWAHVYATEISGIFAAGQGITFPSNGITLKTGSGSGGDVRVVDIFGNGFVHINNSGLYTSNVENPIPVVHAAQTGSAQAVEYGNGAATGGVLAVTFATAFASAPSSCICVGTNAVATGCVISTAATTTSVSFTFGVGTDVVNWFCSGAK